jgi:hypothetical protein
MAEPETIVVQTGRCGCCPLYTIFPVPTYCEPTPIDQNVVYSASVHLASGSCVSGSWGIAAPPAEIDVGNPPVVRALQRVGQSPFVATATPELPVPITLNGVNVRWRPVGGGSFQPNVLLLVWDNGLSDPPENEFLIRTADSTQALTCLSTQILPNYVVEEDAAEGPLQAFVTLQAVNAFPFVRISPLLDFTLPPGAIVFTRFHELVKYAFNDATFPSSAFVPITWQLNVPKS